MRPYRLPTSAALRSLGHRAVPSLLAVAAAVIALPAVADDDPSPVRKPLAGVTTKCNDCGVVRAIREVRTERAGPRSDSYVASQQYKDTMPAELPRIGPAISLTWGRGERPRTQVGAVGSPDMPMRSIEITYEVSVRFDDGRYGLYELAQNDDLRVGDRVIIINRRIEKVTDE